MNQHQGSPALDGNSTKYAIGGNHPYSDVLWTNPLIRDVLIAGDAADSDHKLIPTLHYFTYDVYFYGSNMGPIAGAGVRYQSIL